MQGKHGVNKWVMLRDASSSGDKVMNGFNLLRLTLSHTRTYTHTRTYIHEHQVTHTVDGTGCPLSCQLIHMWLVLTGVRLFAASGTAF